MSNKCKLAPLDIELILAHVLKKSREYIFAHPEYKLSNLQIKNYELAIKERLNGVPLAYITGEKEFYGFKFFVNQNVLIPRPETELMVDEAIEHIAHNMEHVTIVDVGTGSGCIIIAMFKQLLLNYKLKITNYEFVAIDNSRGALNMAKKNAKLNGVPKNIEFIHGDLLEPLIKNSKLSRVLGIKNSKMLILANLPYLTPQQIKSSPTIKFEPKTALAAGPDGLKYYRKLFQQLKVLCAMCYVLCEIDPSQTANMKKLIKIELPGWKWAIKKDLKGHNRVVVLSNY